MLNELQTIVAIIASVVASVGAVIGLGINISKHRKESRRERIEALDKQQIVLDKLEELAQKIEVIELQNDKQQEWILANKEIAGSHFRMTIYNAIVKALDRGYTHVSEAVEITKLYSIYRKNGGNGEIQSLFKRFEKLKIKEDKYEVK